MVHACHLEHLASLTSTDIPLYFLFVVVVVVVCILFFLFIYLCLCVCVLEKETMKLLKNSKLRGVGSHQDDGNQDTKFHSKSNLDIVNQHLLSIHPGSYQVIC